MYIAKRSSVAGLTLIELLIVIAIIAILALVALPAYQESVQKGRRADARNGLMAAQVAQEQYRAYRANYATNLADLDLSADGGKYYALSIDSATASNYVIEAAPQGDQASDRCGTFAVNASGPITDNGGYAGADCWQ